MPLTGSVTYNWEEGIYQPGKSTSVVLQFSRNALEPIALTEISPTFNHTTTVNRWLGFCQWVKIYNFNVKVVAKGLWLLEREKYSIVELERLNVKVVAKETHVRLVIPKFLMRADKQVTSQQMLAIALYSASAEGG